MAGGLLAPADCGPVALSPKAHAQTPAEADTETKTTTTPPHAGVVHHATAMGSDGSNLWLYAPMPTPDGIGGGLYVQRERNPDGRLMLTTPFSLPPTAGPLVTENNRVWLLASSGDIKGYRLQHVPPGPAQILSMPLPNLPESAKALALARASDATFLLVRTTAPVAPGETVDRTNPEATEGSENASPDPATDSPADQPEEAPSAPSDENPVDEAAAENADNDGDGEAQASPQTANTHPSTAATTGLTQADIARWLTIDRRFWPAAFRLLPTGPPSQTPATDTTTQPFDDESENETAQHPDATSEDDASPKAGPNAASASASDSKQEAAPVPAREALMVHQGLKWQAIPLPENWPTGQAILRHHVLMVGQPDGQRPLLIDHAPNTTTLYRWLGTSQDAANNTDARGWQAIDLGRFERHGQPAVDLQAAIVDHQLVLAAAWPTSQAEADGMDVAIALSCLPLQAKALANASSHRPHALAEVTLTAPAPHAWSMVAHQQNIDLYPWPTQASDTVPLGTKPPLIELAGKRVLMTGQVTDAPRITEYQATRLDRQLDFMLLVLVLIVSTVVVLFVWPREIKDNQLYLPSGMTLAMPGRRIIGGFIDLMPCVYLAEHLFDTTNEQILYFWPGMGHAQRAEDLLPALFVIGLYTVHTTVTEVLTGHSLGKFVCRTRIVGMKGEKPSMARLLVRGVMKPIDLVGLPLLTMALFHNRQRFAGLLAKTVVVQQQSQDADDAPPSDKAKHGPADNDDPNP